jgi:hypothetical protein
MKSIDIGSKISAVADSRLDRSNLDKSILDKSILNKSMLDRRKFFRQAGMFGFGAAVTGMALSGKQAKAQANTYQVSDTTAELFTAFLIAEDLATTFYYNGLIGGVIADPNLAGPGGSATKVTSIGNLGNVNYLQAALVQEIGHANLFRQYLTGYAGGQANDPYQHFYFPAGTFDTLAAFLPILNALENAFIGAYLNLIQEFAYKATAAQTGMLTGADAKYSAQEYGVLAATAASILGVEAEHRVLGRVIGNENPANNLDYQQTDGLTAIFHGPSSAVVALTPFLGPSASFSEEVSLATAQANYGKVTLSIGTSGAVPKF